MVENSHAPPLFLPTTAPKTMSLSDEKIMESVEDTEESYIEIYLRFNRDYEKDYCFQVKTSTTFKDLNKIFTSLPIALKPNIFYNQIPKGYLVSVSPGYLNEDGLLLFDYEAEKNVKKVKLSDKVAEQMWPGQLIVPDWELNDFFFYLVVTGLIVWLYTDLPDFISPTPGNCLTNHVSILMAKVLDYFGYGLLSQKLIDDILEPVTITTQIIFFVIHIVKIIVLFLILWTGLFNPISFNIPLISKKVKPVGDITKDELLALGWTGSRRAGPDEYKEFYREYKIKQHGGLVPAHKAGLFEKLKHLGVFLGPGEGFNTPLGTNVSFKQLISDDNDKLQLSYDYYVNIGEYFERYCESQETAQMPTLLKQFRRYGLLESNANIQKLVENRKKQGDLMLKPE